MSEERDAHYARTANMLWSEIIEKLASLGQCIDECNGFESDHPEDRHYMHSDDLARIMETLIAQRAFDFADYNIKHVHGSDLDAIKHYGLARYFEEFPEGRERVPDMDKWPE